MLIELFGKNFGCFRDFFCLSMIATDIDRGSDRGIARVQINGDSEPLVLLRSVAIYGPNASGKSTVIRAAQALGRLIRSTTSFFSDSMLQSFEPFALVADNKQPVMLGVKGVINGNVYEYIVEFDQKRFVHERLIQLAPSEEILIDRVNQNVNGKWTEDKTFRLIISQEFRPNALLLSLADSLVPGLAKEVAVGLRRLLNTRDQSGLHFYYGRVGNVARRARDDSGFNHWLLSGLRAADIGVKHLEIEEVRQITEVEGESDEDDSNSQAEVEISYRLSLIHQGPDGTKPLSYYRESLGTRRFIQLAPLLYDLAHDDSRRVAFIDELDASMHPLLLEELVREFNCVKAAEKVHGQLVFTAHETCLIDGEAKNNVLRRDQVYFTEKDSNGASRLYSVADFKERNNLNIRKRYLQGRYGALPSLGNFSG